MWGRRSCRCVISRVHQNCNHQNHKKKPFKQFCSNYIKSFKSGIFLVLLDNNLSSEWHQKASIPLFKCAKDIGSESFAYLLQCPSHQCKCLCPIAGSLESEKMGKIKVVSFQIKLHVRLKAKNTSHVL